jgi:hypothetical protein
LISGYLCVGIDVAIPPNDRKLILARVPVHIDDDSVTKGTRVADATLRVNVEKHPGDLGESFGGMDHGESPKRGSGSHDGGAHGACGCWWIVR